MSESQIIALVGELESVSIDEFAWSEACSSSCSCTGSIG
ncbi:hypothetical protein Psal006b_02465 [Piscirickettsia salmonis]|uniref:Uncharacterized protein n=1 Tax=Piscirickettsia salmonis TaxID=1238 RepID=A0A9Q6LJ92_PISSA|nr:hypothetical protein KW89_770 [Piscirickettsia salmonis]ERL63466.1 hypothetical protein K661_00128 [Piscirickettsia salmonis LF-89 = ATCC VR-1361]ALB21932.1 hypothetical protein KU39_748 [Piscirickettsia salmonis]QGN76610.1 hypothetical protein Psal001_00794 [Piscirickettsia salmonis]QGN80200.1 hypothetical protein Psal002_00819 [Piscirickettsia salmonis]